MNYAKKIKYDTANGEGFRTTLYVSGCPHHCKGCFNEITWDYNYGSKFTEETMQWLIESSKNEFVKGLSILGGEPLADKNFKAVIDICKEFKKIYPKKDIWLWTGYKYEDICNDKEKRNIFLYIDYLIDGKFEEDKKDLSLKYAGSTNQKIYYFPFLPDNFLSEKQINIFKNNA